MIAKYQSNIPIDSPDEDYRREYFREELFKQELQKSIFKRRNLRPYNEIIKRILWKR